MFPSRITITPSDQEILIDKKKFNSYRPQAIVDKVLETQKKVSAANFNADRFVKEFSAAYFTYLTVKGKSAGTWAKLTDVYKYMAPTARARKDYDTMSYAFDLARLFSSDYTITSDGYEIAWDTSRDIQTGAIRILDGNGIESYLKSVKFTESKL